MENNYYPFVNQPLPYEYNAMEPYIDEKTMRLHHDRHLQTYIDNLNAVLRKYPNLQKLSLEELIENAHKLLKEVQVPIRNNAGGVYNHRFFFEGLRNPSQRMPEGKLARAIDKQFGSFDKFKDKMKEAALAVFGSGYAWLVLDKDGDKLRIMTTPNQNTPLESGWYPLLTVDVWEHAYYLKHYNMRAKYIEDWFQVINWKKVEERYKELM